MGDRLKCQLCGWLNVLSRGILSKTQKKRYCVFYVAPDGSSPQIHVFEKEEHFKKDTKALKVLHLEGDKRLQYTKERNGFDVITRKDRFSFVAENSKDLKKWVGTLKVDLNITTILEPDGSAASDEEESDSHLYMDDNIIYETADLTPMFSVVIEDNEAAGRCQLQGNYFLVVNMHNLALVDCKTKKAIYQWPFKYIRRFGKTRTNFQFEAGRRCPSGEGEFSFLTEEGFKIFDTFTKTTQKIKHFEDQPVQNPLKTSGHVRAKSDGQNSNHPNLLRTSGHHDKPSAVPGSPEGHQPHPGAKMERRSVKSGGTLGHAPDNFASELNSVLKQKDDHMQGAGPVRHPSGDNLKEPSKKEKHKVDKKMKKEKEKEEKAREKEEKAREKEEKAREKEEKMKEKDKKGKKKKVEPSVSLPLSPSHTYEEVDDIPGRQTSRPGPEPLYAEAADTAVVKPIPKPKPRKEQKTELYSEPQKLKKDAWKEHGREEHDSEHQEDYDKIRVAASNLKENRVEIDPREVEPDGTYDHIGNILPSSKANMQESVYGTASGKSIASIKKEKAEIHEYEEANPKANPKKKAAQVDAYEDPELISPSVRLPADGEDENAYADIGTT